MGKLQTKQKLCEFISLLNWLIKLNLPEYNGDHFLISTFLFKPMEEYVSHKGSRDCTRLHFRYIIYIVFNCLVICGYSMTIKEFNSKGSLQVVSFQLEHSYSIDSLIIQWGSRPVGLPLNQSPFSKRTGKHLPALHVQSKSKTQGARDSHQRAFR